MWRRERGRVGGGGGKMKEKDKMKKMGIVSSLSANRSSDHIFDVLGVRSVDRNLAGHIRRKECGLLTRHVHCPNSLHKDFHLTLFLNNFFDISN